MESPFLVIVSRHTACLPCAVVSESCGKKFWTNGHKSMGVRKPDKVAKKQDELEGKKKKKK